jgi:hypothetical protein
MGEKQPSWWFKLAVYVVFGTLGTIVAGVVIGAAAFLFMNVLEIRQENSELRTEIRILREVMTEKIDSLAKQAGEGIKARKTSSTEKPLVPHIRVDEFDKEVLRRRMNEMRQQTAPR